MPYHEQYGFNESEKAAQYKKQGGRCACCKTRYARSSMQAHHNHCRPSKPTYYCKPCHFKCVHRRNFAGDRKCGHSRTCRKYD